MIVAGVLSFVVKGVWWFGFAVGAVVTTVVLSLWNARKGVPDKGQANVSYALGVLILVVALLLVLRAFNVI